MVMILNSRCKLLSWQKHQVGKNEEDNNARILSFNQIIENLKRDQN